jgi:Txe/YoeB family toxin of Txe-Axe toxin-antitoxin module
VSRGWEIRFTKQARKDVDKLSKLREKLRDILVEVRTHEPYAGKRLVGELDGSYSYRLTFNDRIVYSLDEDRQILYVERARTHYGE